MASAEYQAAYNEYLRQYAQYERDMVAYQEQSEAAAVGSSFFPDQPYDEVAGQNYAKEKSGHHGQGALFGAHTQQGSSSASAYDGKPIVNDRVYGGDVKVPFANTGDVKLEKKRLMYEQPYVEMEKVVVPLTRVAPPRTWSGSVTAGNALSWTSDQFNVLTDSCSLPLTDADLVRRRIGNEKVRERILEVVEEVKSKK
ncbi:hypothetical protein BC829DRAFT_394791, partial [Chytridium lagenaria]